MTADELTNITYTLRRLVLSRWSDDEIMKHVAIELPAPIFDQVVAELARELSAVHPVRRAGIATSFTFAGATIRRLDGRYWTVEAQSTS